MIADEFLFIAKSILRRREGIRSLHVKAVRPTPRGPQILYDGDPIGPAPPGRYGPRPHEPSADMILEGVARMLAIRWRSGPPRTLLQDDASWRQHLAQRYPGTFDEGGPGSWSGWRYLWEAGAQWIEDVGRPTDWSCGQTKEKFGTIRWYVHGSLNDEHQAIIRTIEAISAFTCEYCGAPGQLRKGGWVKVCCDTHAGGKKAFSDV